MEGLEQLLSEELLTKLKIFYGGSMLYIPTTISHRHPLTRAIGLVDALRLSNLYGGDTVYIPKIKPDLAARNAEIISRLQQGYRCETVARHYDLTTRQIRAINKQAPAN